jgi:hypothetical protein
MHLRPLFLLSIAAFSLGASAQTPGRPAPPGRGAEYVRQARVTWVSPRPNRR